MLKFDLIFPLRSKILCVVKYEKINLVFLSNTSFFCRFHKEDIKTSPEFLYHILYDLLFLCVRGMVRVDCVSSKIHVCQLHLCVSHAGSCYESLLQSFVLQSAVLLLPLSTPF